MDKFSINGPNTLNGTIKIGGAKNAVLPLMTACIIHPGEYILNNVPILRDTMTMAKLLEMVGAKVEINGNSFSINTKGSITFPLDFDIFCPFSSLTRA